LPALERRWALGKGDSPCAREVGRALWHTNHKLDFWEETEGEKTGDPGGEKERSSRSSWRSMVGLAIIGEMANGWDEK